MEIEVIKSIEKFLPLYRITNSEAILITNPQITNDGDTEEIGAGFGNSETNKQVEEAAISYVTKDYQKKGWTVTSVESEKRGYDLVCIKDFIQEHVEVKGIQGSLISFIITSGEVKQSQIDENFFLCAVTSALSNPILHRFSAHEFREKFALEAISYRVSLKQR